MTKLYGKTHVVADRATVTVSTLAVICPKTRSPREFHFVFRAFKALTGHRPFPWQEKMYEQFGQGQSSVLLQFADRAGKDGDHADLADRPGAHGERAKQPRANGCLAGWFMWSTGGRSSIRRPARQKICERSLRTRTRPC